MDDPSNMVEPAADPRRDFLRKLAAICAGLAAMGIPGVAGLAVLLDPLRRKSTAPDGFVRIAMLSAIPDDGAPHRFTVTTDKIDGWTKTVAPVGAVYLIRKGDSITAFNASCPHAGCAVSPNAENGFNCPCHASKFNSDGSPVPGSVTPRGLDPLEIDSESLQSGVVQLRYQNFLAGHVERIPLS